MKKTLTFPVQIKKTGVPSVTPSASLYYILAADGWYQVRKNKMYETCTKVDHPVPGYEVQKEYCKTNMPVIPNDIMDRVMSFFRKVHDDLAGEAIVELFYQPEAGAWLAMPPYQGIPSSTSSQGGYWGAMGAWVWGAEPDEGGSGITSMYGTAFEEHAEIGKAPDIYEQWDADLKKYVPCKKATKGSSKKPVSGGWAHDLVYQPSTSEEWPEGYRRIGTIHSHPYSDAYFSFTDDADDKYGDGMHLVFGFIFSTVEKIHIGRNVKASFCSNGQRFQWEKKENDQVMEEFIDIDAPVPPEWFKKCHEVTMSDGIYVSLKPKKPKADHQPKPVSRGPGLIGGQSPNISRRVAKPSNVRLIQKDGSFKVGDGKP